MKFNIQYIVRVDKDTNMFRREDYEKLIALLRKKEDGNHLETVDFRKSKFKNLNLSGLNLSNFDFSESNLKNVDFSNCILDNCNFERSTLQGCNFDHVQMKEGSLFYIKAKECSFVNAYLSWNLRWMEVENCDFSYATFTGLMTSVDFRTCKMEGYESGDHLTLSAVVFPGESYE